MLKMGQEILVKFDETLLIFHVKNKKSYFWLV
jgi:hypothetical protein